MNRKFALSCSAVALIAGLGADVVSSRREFVKPDYPKWKSGQVAGVKRGAD